MGCACEDGARDSFYAAIIEVMERPAILAGFDKLQEKLQMPQLLFDDLRKRVENGSLYCVRLKCQDGSTMAVASDIFPQTLEWAKARVGKPLHVFTTQLPNRHGGGFSLDVHEMVHW